MSKVSGHITDKLKFGSPCQEYKVGLQWIFQQNNDAKHVAKSTHKKKSAFRRTQDCGRSRSGMPNFCPQEILICSTPK